MTYIDTDEPEAEAPASVWAAIIASDPTDLSDLVSVTIPALDANSVWEDCKWQARDATSLPQSGDTCVVVMDNTHAVTVVMWWPFADTVPLDSDANAFVTAAGITDPSLISAVNTLVTDLKNGGVWSLLHAIYPFVGGNATAHKYNLKDPRDLDAAYRLTFAGGWTHDSTGILPNGSSGYADTHLNLSTVLTTISGSFGVYSRTLGQGLYDMASSNNSDTQGSILVCHYTDNKLYTNYGTNDYTHNTASTDGRGFFQMNRVGTTTTRAVKNGVSVNSFSEVVSLANETMYIGACNRGGTAAYFGSKNLALAFIGDGMTSGQYSALYTAVQAFQVALGREV